MPPGIDAGLGALLAGLRATLAGAPDRCHRRVARYLAPGFALRRDGGGCIIDAPGLGTIHLTTGYMAELQTMAAP